MVEHEHPFVKLARETIKEYAQTRTIKEVQEPLAPELQEQAGVFVSLKKYGHLRGCIGTVEPTKENLAKEIIRNAISAANHDPRFDPVRPEEIAELEISVDVLGQSEEVNSKDELDPLKYGVIVERGYQRGLLLPNLDGVNTVEEQLDIARRKAGLPSGVDYRIYRFEVKRYK